MLDVDSAPSICCNKHAHAAPALTMAVVHQNCSVPQPPPPPPAPSPPSTPKTRAPVCASLSGLAHNGGWCCWHAARGGPRVWMRGAPWGIHVATRWGMRSACTRVTVPPPALPIFIACGQHPRCCSPLQHCGNDPMPVGVLLITCGEAHSGLPLVRSVISLRALAGQDA